MQPISLFSHEIAIRLCCNSHGTGLGGRTAVSLVKENNP